LTDPAIRRRVRGLLLDVGGVVIRTPFELLDLAEERLVRPEVRDLMEEARVGRCDAPWTRP
jgi:hypothetical protein